VAKLVDDLDTPALISGLRVAEYLAALGLACGAPIRTRDGELAIQLPQGALALGALIDWTTTLRGPLLYDLACFAVITSSAGPQAARWFTQGYVAQLPEIGPELAYLDHLVKARWLANAIYFSSRIERGIKRGSGSPTANEDGLAAAYSGMTAPPVAWVVPRLG
jgi:hypothetical protein